MRNELPKGMEPEVVEMPEPEATVTLKDGNYVSAIYQALDLIPVEITVKKCIVIEQDGMMPEVRLTLVIEGKKEGGETDGDTGILTAEQNICGERQ